MPPSPPTHEPDAAISARKLLSTGTVAPDKRLEYWLELVCSTYVQLECEPPADQPIFGDIEFSRIGALHFTHLRSNGRRVWRTEERIRASSEDYCLVLLQRQGRGAVRQDGRTAIVRPGDFVFNDCTRPYELLFDEPGHELTVLRLPRTQLENHVGNLKDLTSTTVGSRGAAGQLLLSMVATLHRDIDTLHPSSALGVSEAITSIIGAGLRSLPGANVRKASSLASYHTLRVKAYVREHLRDPELSIESIAQAMQLSPNHLCRLFRSEPVPLSRLIWQWRLDGCRRDLADVRLAERSVSEIAFAWGYNDAAHFSRGFRERYGMSPREWRGQQSGADGL